MIGKLNHVAIAVPDLAAAPGCSSPSTTLLHNFPLLRKKIEALTNDTNMNGNENIKNNK